MYKKLILQMLLKTDFFFKDKYQAIQMVVVVDMVNIHQIFTKYSLPALPSPIES